MPALTPSSFAPWGAGLPLPGYHSFLPYYIVVLTIIAIVIVTLTITIIIIVVSVLIETGKGRAGRVEAWEKITSQNSATLRLPSTGTIGTHHHLHHHHQHLPPAPLAGYGIIGFFPSSLAPTIISGTHHHHWHPKSSLAPIIPIRKGSFVSKPNQYFHHITQLLFREQEGRITVWLDGCLKYGFVASINAWLALYHCFLIECITLFYLYY